jgi:hypothetical protein
VKKISAKRLREMLSTVRVYNDHGLSMVVSPTPPVVSYTKAERYWSAKWSVWRVGHRTDPKSHWHDGGAKVFTVEHVNGSLNKDEQFTAAIAWANERYTKWSDEWVKTPFGAWMPKDALEAALRHHLPELFVTKGAGDPVVKRITDKLYADDPEWAESTAVVDPLRQPVGDISESIRKAFDLLEGESRTDASRDVDVSTVETDGWYRVVGAGVAVFIQATGEQDALNRVEHMTRRVTMDVDTNLHVIKRDPEVN